MVFAHFRSIRIRQSKALYAGLIFAAVFLYTSLSSSTTKEDIIEVIRRKVEFAEITVPASDIWLQQQEERREAMHKSCKDIPKDILFSTLLALKESRRHLLVDDCHKAIYCFVPKVASVNWRKAWMLWSGMSYNITGFDKTKVEAAFETKTLRDIVDKEEIKYKLSHYKKVIVVRHPLERLLSVYLDILNHPDLKREAHHFALKTHPDVKDDNVSWSEFVNFIITEGVIASQYLLTHEDLCHPCAIDYDVVVKFETFKEDSLQFLEQIGASKLDPVADPSPLTLRVNAELFRNYSKSLSESQLLALKRKYNRDMQLFQYF